MEKTNKIFERLWNDYILQNPEVKKVYDLLVNAGEEVENDHIAFRTFDDPRINIDVLAKPFQDAGYEFRGDYSFEQKHLYAKHYEHRDNKQAPRIFISELLTKEFSPFLQTTVKEVVDRIPDNMLEREDINSAGNLWGEPVYKTYKRLKEESEYAAWLYVYGFRANHFTVSVNALKKFKDIYQLNQFLKDNGFVMNEAGGEVKGSPEELLEQSSIRAGKKEVSFLEGKFDIPSCYYEFAKRYTDKTGELYGGFIAKSADKIFESTDNLTVS